MSLLKIILVLPFVISCGLLPQKTLYTLDAIHSKAVDERITKVVSARLDSMQATQVAQGELQKSHGRDLAAIWDDIGELKKMVMKSYKTLLQKLDKLNTVNRSVFDETTIPRTTLPHTRVHQSRQSTSTRRDNTTTNTL